ncbi:deoxyribonuclease V [Chloroflexota bacterium]
MKVMRLHSWQVSTAQALDIQRKLATQVSRSGEVSNARLIAGVDISVNRVIGMTTGAVIVLKYPEFNLVETSVVTGELGFPYVPGLLSFRESPLLLTACERLTVTPDLIMVDGQGIAHPHHIGLASHLGLFLNTPAIGCAKSRLCGSHEEVGTEVGSYTELVDNGEVISEVVRTKLRVKPLYVSTGHGIDLLSAIRWVLAWLSKAIAYRDPTRLAHLAAGGNLKLENDITVSCNDRLLPRGV